MSGVPTQAAEAFCYPSYLLLAVALEYAMHVPTQSADGVAQRSDTGKAGIFWHRHVDDCQKRYFRPLLAEFTSNRISYIASQSHAPQIIWTVRLMISNFLREFRGHVT